LSKLALVRLELGLQAGLFRLRFCKLGLGIRHSNLCLRKFRAFSRDMRFAPAHLIALCSAAILSNITSGCGCGLLGAESFDFTVV
jgi:hypothetical protein